MRAPILLALIVFTAVGARAQTPPTEPTQAECLANGFNVIVGTNGNDNITGTNGDDCIFALDGDDDVDGLDGDDIIIGGAGKDHLDGDGGDDTLFGGPGENTLHGKEGNDIIVGGPDADDIDGDAGNDTIFAGDGDDKIVGDEGDDFIDGGAGNDDIDGDAGNDTILGGDGDDKIEGKDGDDFIDGGAGNDEIKGDKGNDTILGGDGDDKIEGKDGNDVINGGAGNDDIKGDDGNDTILGGDGDDEIDGGNDDDFLDGGAGNDDLDGGNGDDNCVNGTPTGACENLTPASLESMRVAHTPFGARISWETSSESGVISFAVRSSSGRIIGRALARGSLGGQYVVIDPRPTEGVRYTLVELDARRQERALANLPLGGELSRPRTPRAFHSVPAPSVPAPTPRVVVGQVVRTPGPGLYAVRDPALVAAARAGTLRVTLAGRDATWRLTPDALELYSPRPLTGFAAGNTFVLSAGPSNANADAVEDALQDAARITRFEEDLFPGLVAARDPAGDPWFWRGLGPGIAGAERASFSVPLAPADGAQLHLYLHGASEGQHRALVRWNGAVVDEVELNGRLPIRKTLLLEEVGANNTLELVALGEPGSAWYLDAFEIERASAPVDARPVAELTPAPLHLNELRSSDNAADYLILTPASLREGAERLAALRAASGWTPMVVELDEVYDAFSHSAPDPRAVHALLQHAYLRWELAPRVLVVLGAGSFDYQDRFGAGANLVPPPMLDTPHGLFAADATWGELDAGRPGLEVAVGRLPARDATELDAMLDKLALPPPDLDESLAVADRADPAADYSAQLRARFSTTLSLDDQPRDPLRVALQDAWSSAGLVVYAGHGGLDRWSDEVLLNTADAAALEGSPIVLALSCSTSRDEIPGVGSLASALLRAPGGARAYFGASGVSNHNDVMPLLDALRDELGRSPTLADAWLEASARHATKREPFIGTATYQWFGDPGAPLRERATEVARQRVKPATARVSPLPAVDPGEPPVAAAPTCSTSPPSGALGLVLFALFLARRRR